jgi:segregation and condensation protein A
VSAAFEVVAPALPSGSELFQVRQPNFSGTLRELASALRSGALAPSALDLLQLVKGWLEHFTALAQTDMDQASVALPGVAQVIELKLRLLLPRPPREDGTDEDLTEVLGAVALLEELDDAIDFLRLRREQRRVLHPASAPGPRLVRRERAESLAADTLMELASRLRSHAWFEVLPDTLDVATATAGILRQLEAGRPLTLRELAGNDWAALTVFFAALLELLREGRVTAVQLQPFLPIEVRLGRVAGPEVDQLVAS